MNSLFDLNGKVALVTGGTGLLGREHCTALAEAGAHVVVADLDKDRCSQFAAGLSTPSIGLAMDVTDKRSILLVKDEIMKSYGRLDILVNNAAINDMFESPQAAAEQSKFENYPLEFWQKSMSVNVTGMFLCSQTLGVIMAGQKSGSIINIASTYGVVAPNQGIYRDSEGTQKFYKSAAYPTTKGAVLAFTRFLAAYWGSAGVRVNALSPGGVENSQDQFFIQQYAANTPLNRMAHTGDYKGAIVFLASDASSYMTGANLIVDGGWTAW